MTEIELLRHAKKSRPSLVGPFLDDPSTADLAEILAKTEYLDSDGGDPPRYRITDSGIQRLAELEILQEQQWPETTNDDAKEQEQRGPGGGRR